MEAILSKTTKDWYRSKILWVNLIAVAGLFAQSQYGYVLSPELQGGILALINLALRIVTKEELNWSPGLTEDPGTDIGQSGYIRLPLLPILVLFALAIMLTGCATPGPNPVADDNPQILAGKSLLAVKSSIVTAATAVDSLCKSATLTPDVCRQAQAAYLQAQPAYDAAVDAYLLLSVQGGDPAAFGAALIRVQAIAQNLLLITGGAK